MIHTYRYRSEGSTEAVQMYEVGIFVPRMSRDQKDVIWSWTSLETVKGARAARALVNYLNGGAGAPQVEP